MLEEVKIEKLVHGGQGLGILSNGQKIFVWNALPGETVGVRVGRKKRGYAEGFAEKIIKPSKERVSPIDEAYLSTSPWQILTWPAENKYKKEILIETFERAGIKLDKFNFVTGERLGRAAGDADSVRAPREGVPKESGFSLGEGEKHGTGVSYGYRNKMEYSFWGDDDGLHLALFHRASHSKQIVLGSSIAQPEIDRTANNIVAILNKNGVRGSQLKSVVLRSNKKREVVAALFTKDKQFPQLKALAGVCKGVAVYYSDPKSPASVVTNELYVFGSVLLHDEILGQKISYDVNSFFQVNLPIFEAALQTIKDVVKDEQKIIDMYAGVGTIGLNVGARTIIELDQRNISMAKHNVKQSSAEVVQANTEQALEYITDDSCIIFDPPRAGLHDKVVQKLLDTNPTTIIYLSCNPSTQARDIAKLQYKYQIESFAGYNFFPRTPHIESLAILQKTV